MARTVEPCSALAQSTAAAAAAAEGCSGFGACRWLPGSRVGHLAVPRLDRLGVTWFRPDGGGGTGFGT
jgi:hypothetical protein